MAGSYFLTAQEVQARIEGMRTRAQHYADSERDPIVERAEDVGRRIAAQEDTDRRNRVLGACKQR